MKRFLAVFMAVMLVVALSVPAFALEYNNDTFGEYYILDGEKIYFTEFADSYDFYITGYSLYAVPKDTYSYDGQKLHFTADSGVIYFSCYSSDLPMGSHLDYYVYKSETEFVANNSYALSNAEQVVFTETSYMCDGTTCPATDVNMDNYCDDCGAVFAVLRDYPAPDGWPTSYPSPPAFTNYSYSNMLLHELSDGTMMLYMIGSNEEMDLTGAITSGDGLNVVTDAPISVFTYKLLDNGTWYYQAQSNTKTLANSLGTIHFSNFNVYNSNGELFFPLPLWAEMERVTQGEMTGLTQTMAGTMKILVLCGVGLMALLVGLLLFGKVFKRFRVH